MRFKVMNGWIHFSHHWTRRKFWISFDHTPGYATTIGLCGFTFWFF